MSLSEENKEIIGTAVAATIVLFVVIATGWGVFALSRVYSVWAQGKEGQAELSKAQWNRQIAVQEAKAKEESSILLAQAEVERAKGVAQANKIIGDSLKNNEAYLRYLWITDVAGTNVGKSVVYVPTEANLPILEANRFTTK